MIVRTDDSIFIHAPPQRVFEIFSNVAHWPRHLPHYRYVKNLDAVGQRLRMGAWRGWFPIRWTCTLDVDRSRRQFCFTHRTAFIRALRILWTFEPATNGTYVTVRHDLDADGLMASRLVAERIIGRHLLHPLSIETLKSFKRHIEQSTQAESMDQRAAA